MSNADMYNELKSSTVSDGKERVAFNLLSSRIRELLQTRGINPQHSGDKQQEIKTNWRGASGLEYNVLLEMSNGKLAATFSVKNRVWAYRSNLSL